MESQPSEEVPLPIPAPLRGHMEDECFWILCQNKLLKLPRKPNVEDLLRHFYYQNIATPTEETSPALLTEVLDGIKIYFDFMTEHHLLYSPEREQFKAMVTDRNSSARPTDSVETSKNSSTSPHLEHTSQGNLMQSDQQHTQLEPTTSTPSSGPPLMPSQVYGAEHLLRLFLKFPLFLCHAQLPYTHVQLLHHHFKELLAYLTSRRGELFSEENYESSTSSEEDSSMTKTDIISTTSGGGGGVGVQAPPTSATPTSDS